MANSRRGSRGASRKSASPELIAALRTAQQHHEAGRLPEAEQGYRAVLQADPGNADALHLLGVLASQVGNYDIADQLIAGAIKINADDAGMHFNHAVVLQQSGRLDAAIAAYRSAIRLKPTYREAFENLGVALADTGDLKAAGSAYRNAIKLGDQSALAQHNLGALQRDLGDPDSAERHYRRALELNPAYPDAHLKLAQARLVQGDLVDGFERLEWRNHAADSGSRLPERSCPLPVYPGSASGRVLVEAEQGVGDEVMFASCLADLIEQNEECVVQCDARLLKLFARSFPNASFVDSSAAPGAAGEFDWRLPAGSLPRHFRHSLDDFGDGSAYLRADPEVAEAFRKRLSALPGSINIGLSWRGGKADRARAARSLSLSSFDWLLEDSRLNIINLQYGDHDAEIRECGSGLVCWDDIDPLAELDDFCALVTALDLVISVDNSTVHFAGALGVPAFVLIPTTGEWRWIGNKPADTPWYRSLRLFHQREAGKWTAVLRQVQEAFAAFEPPSRAESGTADAGRIYPVPGRAATLLLNDTSGWGHWGHACTSIALHRALTEQFGLIDTLPAQQTLNIRMLDLGQVSDEDLLARLRDQSADMVRAIEACERLVINGDDMLAWPGAHALLLLRLARLAKSVWSKRVEIVNHSVTIPDQQADLYRSVYDSVDRVVVRDPASADQLRALGIDVIQGFDCLPLLVDGLPVERDVAPRSCVTVSGSVGLAADDAAAIGDTLSVIDGFGLTAEVLLGAPATPAPGDLQFVESMHARVAGGPGVHLASSETEWLNRIASSRLLLTGSFHHALAAAWLGVPWVALPTRSSSIAGLSEQLGAGVCCDPDSLASEVRRSLEAPAVESINESRRGEFRALARLNAGS